MPTTAEMAPGEVARGLGEVKEALKELASEVRQTPDWDDLRRTEAGLMQRVAAEEAMRRAERITADKAIKSLEDWNKWAVRTVGGAVLLAAAAWALAGGLVGA